MKKRILLFGQNQAVIHGNIQVQRKDKAGKVVVPDEIIEFSDDDITDKKFSEIALQRGKQDLDTLIAEKKNKEKNEDLKNDDKEDTIQPRVRQLSNIEKATSLE